MTVSRPALLFSILLILFPGFIARGETSPDSLRIRVHNATDNSPVEFCNIIAKNIPTGALADGQGRATLRVGPRTLRDTLLVSSVGYEKLMVALTPEVAKQDTLHIYLKPKEYPLSEVTVLPPRKTKTLRKGKRHGGGIIGMVESFKRGDCYAWEAGSRGKRTWLTAIEIHSHQPYGDSSREESDSIASSKGKKALYPVEKTRLRINIYDASDKSAKSNGIERWNYTNILHSPLIIQYSNDQVADNRFSYYFPEPVLLPEKALVEIEILDEIPENEVLFFKSNLFGRGVMYRDVNDRSWLKLPVATPFTLVFLEEKL